MIRAFAQATALFTFILLRAAPADDAGQTINALCRRLDDLLPMECACEARISLLENYLKKNGVPKSLRPIVKLSLGPGEKTGIEMKMPSFMGGAGQGLMPAGGEYEGSKAGSAPAFINTVVGSANPRAMSARLKRLSRKAGSVELTKVKEGDETFDVLDFRDTYLPASAIGHLLRLKLWIGSDSLIHRARLYTSLHGILSVTVKYNDFEIGGKKYKAVRLISVLPMLSEYGETTTQPFGFQFENYAVASAGEADAPGGTSKGGAARDGSKSTKPVKGGGARE